MRNRTTAGMEKDILSSNSKKHKRKGSGSKRPKTPRVSRQEPSDSSGSRPSREQRKIARVLETFRKLAEKPQKKPHAERRGSEKREVRRDNGNNHSDKKKRGRPRRVKRKAESRRSDGEGRGIVPLGTLIARSPMYLGRKAWLMRLYRHDQLLKRFSGFEQLVEHKLPLKKRVYLNYASQSKSSLDGPTPMETNGSEEKSRADAGPSQSGLKSFDAVNISDGMGNSHKGEISFNAMHVTA
eukprot:CAMPEP_0170168032 /NCGR_PEP_ID=MMETSP0040_2-20121228/1231_1 /TAXON_ID=641309 /ORGANISM="Lotharella oceanica, Strain CCMP622" /LENGTH=239 /DNA_ID=CAMNT_0010406197 /DNA_START=256 /DNA_END=975 /DNA_ORIENTATION=+